MISRLTVEFETTRTLEKKEGRDFAPEKQYELYKEATSIFRDPPEYKDNLTHVKMFTHSEWEQLSETDKKYKVMSVSDFELASKGSGASAYVSEAEALASLQGSNGHTITMLIYEHLRGVLSGIPLDQIVQKIPQVKPNSDVSEIIYSAFANEGYKYDTIAPAEMVEFVHGAWSELRKQYLFMYGKHGNSITENGVQYNAAWTYDAFMSHEMQQFEDTIFSILHRKISEKLETPLFDDDKYLFFPLETVPDMHISTEENMMSFIECGEYRIQLKGRTDYRLKGVTVDEKFGSEYGLHSRVGRVQSLLYSTNASRQPYTKLSPNSLFYYHWFDISSSEPNSYYIDKTVYPDELPLVIDDLFKLTKTWSENYQYFSEIKRQRGKAMVTPFLASPY